ncbi:MAG: OmpA family protein, partial [Bacteroidota bacterium]
VLLAQSAFIPKYIGEGINTAYDEINPVISPDGKTLFFTRVNHPENTFGAADSEDIWYATLQNDGAWSKAKRIANLNIGRYNSVLSISPDGNTLLLNGVYNKNGNIWKKRGLSITARMGEVWSTPVKLKVKKLANRNNGLKSSASMSVDGRYIVFSFSKAYNGKRTNLFIAKRKENGKWGRPKKMKNVNSPQSDDAPFLSADNKTLYFASDRKEQEVFDIYKSIRQSEEDKAWSMPVSLTDTINSTAWDSYFKTNLRGSYGFFASSRRKTGGSDIYTVKIFEENPFVIVSGKVRNAKSKRLLINKPYRILVDGHPFDSIYVNHDSATYRLKLPLRKRYNVSVALENYTIVVDTVDVLNVREFTVMEKDLVAEPSPYVRIRGRMLIKNTNDIIPAKANPKIMIDGVEYDSAKVNAEEGTYELKLKHGTTYYIQVSAKRFESLPEPFDLTAIDEYREITQDLHADAEKMALVSGTVIDKKTGKPLLLGRSLKIQVEGLEGESTGMVDSLTGVYELRLPLAAAYTISAAAPGYYPLYEAIDLTQEKGEINILKDLILVPIEVGQSIRLNNIFFESGKAILKQESFPELDRVTGFLNDNPEIKIEISGHTDNVGKATTNQKLSQARAKAVADYIITKGIAKERILAKGYGMSKPVASNKTKEGKAQNRRVEFTILDK